MTEAPFTHPAAQLLREYVQKQTEAEHGIWFRQQVQMGLDAANAGDLVSAEEVEAEPAAWRSETRRMQTMPR